LIYPIVFASNDYFVPYISAMMQSVMENARPDNQRGKPETPTGADR